MLLKFFYNKINISHIKLKLIIKKILKFSLSNILIYLDFFWIKSSFILKKIILNIKYSLKSKNIFNFNNLFFKNILIGKDFFLKKIYFRSRGRFSFKKKYFSNLFFFIFI